MSQGINVNEKVTVILPAIGSVEYLSNAIDNILQQTYKNIEILVPGKLNSPLSVMVQSIDSYGGIVKPLFSNNTDYNVIVGNLAGGYSSKATALSGNSHVLIGFEAGTELTTGTRNTLVGYQAGKELTTQSDPVGIGFLV